MITGKESGEMAGANVLVVFYSRTGVTETQALAVGVGAIQGRANIRLRRIRDDAARADAIILAAPYGFSASSSEVAGFLSLLRSLGPGGALSKKIGGAFVSTSLTGDYDPGVASILSSLESVGMTAVPLAQSIEQHVVGTAASANPAEEYTPELAQAQSYGRLIARKAAALKSDQ